MESQETTYHQRRDYEAVIQKLRATLDIVALQRDHWQRKARDLDFSLHIQTRRAQTERDRADYAERHPFRNLWEWLAGR